MKRNFIVNKKNFKSKNNSSNYILRLILAAACHTFLPGYESRGYKQHVQMRYTKNTNSIQLLNIMSHIPEATLTPAPVRITTLWQSEERMNRAKLAKSVTAFMLR